MTEKQMEQFGDDVTAHAAKHKTPMRVHSLEFIAIVQTLNAKTEEIMFVHTGHGLVGVVSDPNAAKRYPKEQP